MEWQVQGCSRWYILASGLELLTDDMWKMTGDDIFMFTNCLPPYVRGALLSSSSLACVRTGKPSRSRMDGELDALCYGEDDWELEAAGGAWARMPEVLRRLYYAPCPMPDAGAASGGGGAGGAGQQGSIGASGDACRAVPHRQSGGGAYYGALQAPNKRRRVRRAGNLGTADRSV